MPNVPVTAVVDESQLARITATHRGFLYQHLYGVACLLRASSNGYTRICIEADEDLELRREERSLYLQIKTRTEKLVPSDVAESLARFGAIRNAHAVGERRGTAKLVVVANVPAGPKLERQAASGLLPNDVEFVLGENAKPTEDILIAPPATVDALVEECVLMASSLSLSALRPATLVWKLAALIARAAASKQREFSADEVPTLCEFVEAQLHPFPRVEIYAPHETEPDVSRLDRIALVLAHEGFGKSSWAGQLAAHSADLCVYFQCVGVDEEVIAPRLVREAVALVSCTTHHVAADFILPGATGLEALSNLDTQAAERQLAITFLVDDFHRVDARTIVDAVRHTKHVKWVLLGRPGQQSDRIATMLNVTPHHLNGWCMDTIAAALASRGCTSGPTEVEALKRLTGGGPLFVCQAVEAIARSAETTEAYVARIEQARHGQRTGQEILIDDTLSRMSSELVRVAAAVTTGEVSAEPDVWSVLLGGALYLSPSEVARSLRTLVSTGVLTASETGELSVHDVFRVALTGYPPTEPESRRIRKGLKEHLQSLLPKQPSPTHLLQYLRLLSDDEDYNHLSDIASGLADTIRDFGITAQVTSLLQAALKSPALSESDEFWVQDTLAYFEVAEGSALAAQPRLARMSALLKTGNVDREKRGAMLNKAILVLGAIGALEDVSQYVPNIDDISDDVRRVALYNLGATLGKQGEAPRQAEAIQMLHVLIAEYLELVGLSMSELFGPPPLPTVQELSERIRPGTYMDNIWRLGDCFDAVSRFAAKLLPPTNPLPHYALPAMKLYNLSGRHKSLVNTARHFAEWQLRVVGDRTSAVELLANHALPAAAAGGLLTDGLLVRAQLTEVLALLGKRQEAQSGIDALAPYGSALNTGEAPSELRDYLDRARQALASPARLPTGWYGFSGSIGLTSCDVRLIMHRGWTVAVGRDVVDGDWGYNAKKGFLSSVGEFVASGSEPVVCRKFRETRESALREAKLHLDELEKKAETDRRRERARERRNVQDRKKRKAKKQQQRKSRR